MEPREVRYYFGRLNLIAKYDDKHAFLLEGLRTSKYSEYWNSLWGFFDIAESSTAQGTFLSGFVVKFKGAKDEEVALPETHQLTDRAIENRVIAKSRFFLHVKSGLMAYHPVGRQITKESFCFRFSDLIQNAYDNFFISAEIQTVEERLKIFEALKAFKSVARVKVYLHPSNPSNSDRWKRIDDRLKKLNAASYTEQYEAKPNAKGLMDIANDEELVSKITMADDGYGKAAVTGDVDGQRRTVSTHDNPIIAEAPGDDAPVDVVLDRLTTVFGKIFERFKK